MNRKSEDAVTDEPEACPQCGSTGRPDLPSGTRTLVLVLWCSFLVAAAATMVCFGLLDPMAADPNAVPPWWKSRRTVYALGFFFLWITAAAAAALVLFMTRTEAR